MSSLRSSFVVAVLLAAIGGSVAVAQTPLGTSFTYQGQLRSGGAPVNGLHDFEFRLFDAATLGNQVGPTACLDEVNVVDGLFTVPLDFGGEFMTDGRWLEVAVRADAVPGNCESGQFTLLSPRQALTAAPFALALPGFWTQNNATSPNIIGGFAGNSVTPGAVGMVVVGGGASGLANIATDDFAVIAGGHNNQAGDGAGTPNDHTLAVVGGGASNRATGTFSTIAGGRDNTAGGSGATVGGGEANTAGGDYSFAAGYRAKVRDPGQSGDEDGDEGTFIWADSTDADFTSTGPNQFLIRAGGGVGINDDNPDAALSVSGNMAINWPAEPTEALHVEGGTTDSAVFARASHRGVHGAATDDDFSTPIGVEGSSAGANGQGVFGNSYHLTGPAVGVYGRAVSNQGTGVYGLAEADNGQTYGVRGGAASPDGYAGYFEGRGYFEGNVGIGIDPQPSQRVYVAAPPGFEAAIRGESDTRGVLGVATENGTGAVGSAQNFGHGVYGESYGEGAGVFGNARANSGVNYGVRGTTDSPDGYAGFFEGRGYFSDNVGVGTTTPSEKLSVVGNICATGTIGVCSDARFTKDVVQIDHALDKVNSLHGVAFRWKRNAYPDHQFSGDPQVGLIAQDVARVMPEVVSQGADGYFSVDYGRLTPVLIEALRELRDEKDRQLAERDAELAELRARMERLERLLGNEHVGQRLDGGAQ